MCKQVPIFDMLQNWCEFCFCFILLYRQLSIVTLKYEILFESYTLSRLLFPTLQKFCDILYSKYFFKIVDSNVCQILVEIVEILPLYMATKSEFVVYVYFSPKLARYLHGHNIRSHKAEIQFQKYVKKCAKIQISLSEF